ncbi:uncharacterized protein [Amphiura filiformis]|uniref:uncharacterized protein n=1 Tax=Amphiura filiformis TaxID=82378 RepID=UPI003B217C6E
MAESPKDKTSRRKNAVTESPKVNSQKDTTIPQESPTETTSRTNMTLNQKTRDRAHSMATEDMPVCVICHDDFHEPKLLPCLHTFCKKCLQQLAQSGDNKEILCPECLDPQPITTDIEKLPDNTLIQHLNSIILASGKSSKKGGKSKKEKDINCSSCDKDIAAVCRCEDCKEFLCQPCVDSHKSMKALRGHSTITMKEWRKRRDAMAVKPQIAKFCSKHKGEEIGNYCVKCRKAACKDCADLEHSGPTHNCIPLEEAVQQSRQQIENALQNTRQAEAKFRGAWEIMDKRNSKLKETVDNLKKQIQDVMIREREEIAKREEAFLEDLKAVDQEKRKEMNAFYDKLEANLEDFWAAQDLADSVLDLGEDYHVMSLEKVLCERLDLLSSWRPSLPSEDLAEIDFVEEDDELESDHVESIVEEEVEDGEIWEMDGVIGGRGAGEGQFDWCRGVTVSLDGHCVVADWGNHRVQVFNKDRSFKCVLNTSKTMHGRLSMPHDAACLPDGRFIAIDKSKFVRVYDPDGKFLFRFETVCEDNVAKGEAVELSCVAVDRRSRVFVGDVKRNVVTVHYSDGLHIKTIPTVAPSHIAITSQDFVVVSCTQKQKVRVMNFEGKFAFQIDVYGDGEKLRPRGVGCDKDDNIYVVHKERGGEKSVHMYDDKGTYVACVATNLNEPYDVELSPDGRVVVSDDDTVKIFRKVCTT